MSVSVAQRLQAAADAGFRDAALEAIVAISLCECGVGSSSDCEGGCNPDCCPGGCGQCSCPSAGYPCVSCGILQWFQYAHPGTAACASDPACAMRMAYSATGGQLGNLFGPWAGDRICYLSHLGAVRAVRATLAPPAGTGPGAGTGPPVLVCPQGWHVVGDTCVSDAGAPGPAPTPAVSCPPGFSFDGTACVRRTAPAGGSALGWLLVAGAVAGVAAVVIHAGGPTQAQAAAQAQLERLEAGAQAGVDRVRGALARGGRPKAGTMTVRDVLRILHDDGWRQVVQRGSHRQLRHDTKPGRVTVAGHPGDDLAPGTLQSIWRQAGLRR